MMMMQGCSHGQCTECRGDGWTRRRRCNDTDVSRGPHQQTTDATEPPPPLTEDQAAVWERVRELPGVRVRLIAPPLPAATRPQVAVRHHQVDWIRFTLATLFAMILVAFTLYLLIR